MKHFCSLNGKEVVIETDDYTIDELRQMKLFYIIEIREWVELKKKFDDADTVENLKKALLPIIIKLAEKANIEI